MSERMVQRHRAQLLGQTSQSNTGRDTRLASFLDQLPNPTVPTSLSQRVLQTRGAGSIDPNVAAVVSSAGDRFLGNILKQALACREQRLQGANLLEEVNETRLKHQEHYEDNKRDRKRRKRNYENAKEKYDNATVQAAKNNAKANGDKPQEPPPEDEYDSVDEEEEYYQNNKQYSANQTEMIILRDLAKPLEARDFDVSGKRGMDIHYQESSEDDYSEQEDNSDDDEPSEDENEEAENGDDDDDASAKTEKTGKTDKTDKKKKPARKKSTSPAPTNNGN